MNEKLIVRIVWYFIEWKQESNKGKFDKGHSKNDNKYLKVTFYDESKVEF